MAQVHDGTTRPLVEPDGDGGHAAVVSQQAAEWTESETGTGSATATHAAEAGKSHYITGIIVTTATPGDALLVALMEGESAKITYNGAEAARPVPFNPPLKLTAGAAASVVVTGGTGATYANLLGYTR